MATVGVKFKGRREKKRRAKSVPHQYG